MLILFFFSLSLSLPLSFSVCVPEIDSIDLARSTHLFSSSFCFCFSSDSEQRSLDSALASTGNADRLFPLISPSSVALERALHVSERYTSLHREDIPCSPPSLARLFLFSIIIIIVKIILLFTNSLELSSTCIHTEKLTLNRTHTHVGSLLLFPKPGQPGAELLVHSLPHIIHSILARVRARLLDPPALSGLECKTVAHTIPNLTLGRLHSRLFGSLL